MGTKIENLTSQIDGVSDTFTTLADFEPGKVSIGYNGQMFGPGENIDSYPSSNQIKLTFVPKTDADADLHDKLMVIYEEIADIVGSAFPP